MDLEELKALCRDYDRDVGTFPENRLEGWAVFCYIERRLMGEDKAALNLPDAPKDWYTKSVTEILQSLRDAHKAP